MRYLQTKAASHLKYGCLEVFKIIVDLGEVLLGGRGSWISVGSKAVRSSSRPAQHGEKLSKKPKPNNKWIQLVCVFTGIHPSVNVVNVLAFFPCDKTV